MTNLAYIAASYGLAAIAVLGLAGDAWRRHRLARRRLTGLEATSGRRRRGRI
jgi:heme exporter protein CcmD